MRKTSINKKKDKLLSFTLPEYGIVIQAKDSKEAVEKAEKLLSKK